MQVVLLERIEKLGQMGDVVAVKDGYARNYLVPQGKALRATKANLAQFERRRVQLEAVNLERKEEASKLARQIDGRAVVIVRQAGEAGQLYGSVNARDIAAAFTAAGVTIERRQVQLPAVAQGARHPPGAHPPASRGRRHRLGQHRAHAGGGRDPGGSGARCRVLRRRGGATGAIGSAARVYRGRGVHDRVNWRRSAVRILPQRRKIWPVRRVVH